MVAEMIGGDTETPVEPQALATELSTAGELTADATAAASAVLDPTPVISKVARMSSRRRRLLSMMMLTFAVACMDVGRVALTTAAMAAAEVALRLSRPPSVREIVIGRSLIVTVTREGSIPSSAAWLEAALEAVKV